MVYVKWQCQECQDIVMSNSFIRHEMNICKCGKSGYDLEQDYSRIMGKIKINGVYDYSFLNEIILCMVKQGFEPFIKIGDKLNLPMQVYFEALDLEKEILEDMKNG